SVPQRRGRDPVLGELRSTARRRAGDVHAPRRRRAVRACVSHARVLLGRDLAARGRQRAAARGQGPPDAYIGRGDRAMAGVALTAMREATDRSLQPLPRARGAAVIMAMLLAALAATIAATHLWQQSIWAVESH